MHEATTSGSACVLRAVRVGSPRAATLRAAALGPRAGTPRQASRACAKGALDAGWASRAKAARRAKGARAEADRERGGGGGGGDAGATLHAMAELRPRRAVPHAMAELQPRHPIAREGNQGGEGRGRRGRRGLPRDGVERTDAAAAVPGDENDGERRKKHRGGERDEQGATLGLTGRPHMQRRRLPNRLCTGRASAPRRVGPPRLRPKTRRGRGEKQAAGGRNGGWAADAWPAHDDKMGRGKGRPRLGCAREANPREGRGFGVFPIYFSCFSLIHH
jgi:hypothetical protein